jgi:hypothetical protein
LGKLKSKHWFHDSELNKLHKELLIECAEHDFRWIDNLLDMTFKDKWYSPVMRQFYKTFSAIAKHKVRRVE